jgi:hypothetical protein
MVVMQLTEGLLAQHDANVYTLDCHKKSDCGTKCQKHKVVLATSNATCRIRVIEEPYSVLKVQPVAKSESMYHMTDQ